MLPTSYAALADSGLDLADLSALPSTMRVWIEEVRRGTPLSAPGEEGSVIDEAGQQTRFEEDLRAWSAEAGRIERGIDVLANAQAAWRQVPTAAAGAPYRAWLLLNRTFAAAVPSREDEPPAGWRLFQLAFVLAHIPTFASRLPAYASAFDPSFDEDAVRILYMSTGGGKTEAFFGIPCIRPLPGPPARQTPWRDRHDALPAAALNRPAGTTPRAAPRPRGNGTARRGGRRGVHSRSAFGSVAGTRQMRPSGGRARSTSRCGAFLFGGEILGARDEEALWPARSGLIAICRGEGRLEQATCLPLLPVGAGHSAPSVSGASSPARDRLPG